MFIVSNAEKRYPKPQKVTKLNIGVYAMSVKVMFRPLIRLIKKKKINLQEIKNELTKLQDSLEALDVCSNCGEPGTIVKMEIPGQSKEELCTKCAYERLRPKRKKRVKKNEILDQNR